SIVQRKRVQGCDFDTVTMRHPRQAYAAPSFLAGSFEFGCRLAIDLYVQRPGEIEPVDVIDEPLRMNSEIFICKFSHCHVGGVFKSSLDGDLAETAFLVVTNNVIVEGCFAISGIDAVGKLNVGVFE